MRKGFASLSQMPRGVCEIGQPRQAARREPSPPTHRKLRTFNTVGAAHGLGAKPFRKGFGNGFDNRFGNPCETVVETRGRARNQKPETRKLLVVTVGGEGVWGRGL